MSPRVAQPPPPFAVGDEVWVSSNVPSRNGWWTVAYVGRRIVQVKREGESRWPGFYMDTRKPSGAAASPNSRIYTKAEREQQTYRHDLVERLRKSGLILTHPYNEVTLGWLERVVEAAEED